MGYVRFGFRVFWILRFVCMCGGGVCVCVGCELWTLSVRLCARIRLCGLCGCESESLGLSFGELGLCCGFEVSVILHDLYHP